MYFKLFHVDVLKMVIIEGVISKLVRYPLSIYRGFDLPGIKLIL